MKMIMTLQSVTLLERVDSPYLRGEVGELLDSIVAGWILSETEAATEKVTSFGRLVELSIDDEKYKVDAALAYGEIEHCALQWIATTKYEKESLEAAVLEAIAQGVAPFSRLKKKRVKASVWHWMRFGVRR